MLVFLPYSLEHRSSKTVDKRYRLCRNKTSEDLRLIAEVLEELEVLENEAD